MARKGIFCIETADWGYGNGIRPTVAPVLELLKGIDNRPYKYGDFSTAEELRFQLRQWTQAQSANYPYLYLATHGDKETVFARRLKDKNFHDDELGLEWFEENLKDKAKNKILIFGGCNILNCDKRRVKRFMKNTGLKAVLGYKSRVDWREAATFELGLLGLLPLTQRVDGNSLNKAIRKLREMHGPLLKRLSFRIVT